MLRDVYLLLFVGERYDFIINANQRPGAYWIQLRALDNCENRGIQQLGILQYSGAAKKPRSPVPSYNNGLAPGVVRYSLYYVLIHVCIFSHQAFRRHA